MGESFLLRAKMDANALASIFALAMFAHSQMNISNAIAIANKVRVQIAGANI